jgi:hypothetical protein
MPIAPSADLEPDDVELQRCIFGTEATRAFAKPRVVSGSQLACMTASLADSANEAETLLQFAGSQEDVDALWGGEVVLAGKAAISSGILEVPRVAEDEGSIYGSAIVQHGLHAPHAAGFDARFEVYIHRPLNANGAALVGSVTGGVSFNFGPVLNDTIVDEGGLDEGLSLILMPADGLRLLSNGNQVGRDSKASTNGWTPMRVQSNGTHANISQDHRLLEKLTNVPVATNAKAATADGFAMGQPWRFAFGGRPSGPVSHKVAHFLVTGVSMLSTLTLQLRESANGQQFSASNLSFTWLLPPILSSVLPASGPRYGGTLLHLYGVNLAGGDDYRCRFDAPALAARDLTVPASATCAAGTRSSTIVRCLTPELLGVAWVRVSITLNGQQYSHASANLTVLGNGVLGAPDTPAWGNLSEPRYNSSHQLPELALWPALGPASGNTTVQSNWRRGRCTLLLVFFTPNL